VAALTVAAVRQRVAAALEAESGWTESRFAPPLFGLDVDQLLHHSFSVEVPSTSPIAADRRQRVTAGVVVDTPALVRFAHQLRGDNQVADYDAALTAEHTLIKTVLGIARTDLHLTLAAVAGRLVHPSGTVFLGTVRFTAKHRLALT